MKFLPSQYFLSNAQLWVRRSDKADGRLALRGMQQEACSGTQDPGKEAIRKSCTVPTEDSSGSEPRASSLSANTWAQKAFCPRLWKRVKRNDFLTKEWKLEIGKHVKNHQNDFQRKMLRERPMTGKFSVTIYCRDLGEWARGKASFPESGSSPCTQPSGLPGSQGCTGKLCPILFKAGKGLHTFVRTAGRQVKGRWPLLGEGMPIRTNWPGIWHKCLMELILFWKSEDLSCEFICSERIFYGKKKKSLYPSFPRKKNFKSQLIPMTLVFFHRFP